jgi:UPF0755 protein
MKNYLQIFNSSGLRKTAAAIGMFFITVIIIGAYSYYNIHHFIMNPGGNDTQGKIVTINPGQGFSSTTAKLRKEGVISSSVKFKIYGALSGKDKKIKAGEYQFSLSMSPYKILSDLNNGKVYQHKLTIPEGYTVNQIAESVQNAGITSKESFLAVADDPSVVHKLGIPAPAESFEGYLFPETYYFPKGTNPLVIITHMVERFRSVYKKEWAEREKELGMTMHQVLTLASIIEKETGNASERPLISSVFHNRLKKDMRLESDPTVIYGIKDFNGNLTKENLMTVTPYNTYRVNGLPPGPIANPGLKSIEAALFPDQSEYLFFVSKKDTTHQFSTNLTDHINAIHKYQLHH